MTQDELKARLRRVLGKRLRQVFKFSGLRTIAKNAQPYCSECGAEENLEVDHEPSISPVDRDITEPLEYFKRMFCMDDAGIIDLGKLDVLCSEHHAEKTKREMTLRAKHKTGPYSPKSKERALQTRARKKKRRKKVRR
jgi:hypothetical protein